MKKIAFKLLSAALCLAVLLSCFAGCSRQSGEGESQSDSAASDASSEREESTQPVTAAPTTAPTTEETTAAIQGIVDTLESQHFYLAGAMELHGGESFDVKMTCDGDDSRLEMSSQMLNMSVIYLDSTPYVVNNSSKSYVVFDQAAIDSLDSLMTTFSSMGVNMTGADMEEMKSMLSNFDATMDYSGYINEGEASEYKSKIDGVEYICTNYKTEYGAVSIYTLDGELKFIEAYDASGLRQMNISVSAFIPSVLTPITLNGLTKASSLVALFTS